VRLLDAGGAHRRAGHRSDARAVAGELPPLSPDALAPDVRALPGRLRGHAAL